MGRHETSGSQKKMLTIVNIYWALVCARHFICKLANYMLLSSFYRRDNQSSERLSNLPRLYSKVEPCIIWFQSPCSFYFIMLHPMDPSAKAHLNVSVFVFPRILIHNHLLVGEVSESFPSNSSKKMSSFWDGIIQFP